MLTQAEAEDDQPNADQPKTDQPKTDQKAVAPAQIAEWIIQLDDDLYDNRKNAQEGLENSGQQALEATFEEARIGSLESSTRALNIILSWTESSDPELQIAALEKLVTLPNRPIESGLAAELLADAHELEALEAFANLGGKHTNLPYLIENRLPALHLKIDLSWQGELEGLKHLPAIRRAMIVSFRSVPIDDEVFEYLENLPNLRRIELIGTKITEEMVEKKRKEMPGVLIDHRKSAARLGISTLNGRRQGPVIIDKVFPGTAAAKAGLLTRDAITEFEGEKIRDFLDLTTRIGKFQPGDSIELTIMRDGKTIKKTISFDRWGDDLMESPNKALGQVPGRQPGRRKIILERR